MDKSTTIDQADGSGNGVELAKSDKHLDLLRPSARYYSVFKGKDDKGKYSLIKDVESLQSGLYDKPLPCFGCGVGWFSFLLGIICPLMWYYGTFLYFGNYYRKDPRERAGLAASAIAAMTCSVAGHWDCASILVTNTGAMFPRHTYLKWRRYWSWRARTSR